MIDQDTLQAIRDMMREEMQPVTQRLDTMQSDITTLKEDIDTLKDSVEEVRSTTNYLAEWVEKLETAFHKHEVTQG